MKLKIFFYIATLFTLCPWLLAEAQGQPNFILIVLDDFGRGQFPTVAEMLSADDLDPHFAEYVGRQRGTKSYLAEDGIDAARKAMPLLKSLANSGMFFDNAFAASALCAPSRCGLVSGLHPNRMGIYVNIDVTKSPGAMRPKHFMAPLLKAANYTTAHIGKWHCSPHDDSMLKPIFEEHGIKSGTYVHGIPKTSPGGKALVESGYFGSICRDHQPLELGYDYYFGYNFHQSKFYGDHNVWENRQHAGHQQGYNTENFTDKAIDFIERSTSPFFVSLNYHAVHGPLLPNPPKRYMLPFEGLAAPLRNFYGHVHAVDQNIARIVASLKEKGIYENTCIVFTSDNGCAVSKDNVMPGNAPYRGQKGQYTQGGIGVPLFFSWPDRIKGGKTCSELVSHLDIMPTFLAAAGIAPVADIDGASLLPLLDGGKVGPHQHLVWFGLQSISWGFDVERSLKGEGVRNHEPGTWVVRTRDHLLRYTGDLKKGLYNNDAGGRGPVYELYNVEHYPVERDNLYASKPELASQMSQLARQRSKQIVEPLFWRKSSWRELVNSFR